MKTPRFFNSFLSITLGAGIFVAPAFALQMGDSSVQMSSQPLYGELQTKIETKKATPGEPIKAKLLAPAALQNGVDLPKGAILTGKVAQASSKSAGNGTASVMIVFNHVQADKKASPISIHGILIGVAPKPYLASNGPSAADLPHGSTVSTGQMAEQTGTKMDSYQGSESPISTGSGIKNVALSSSGADTGTLTSSHGDFKLDNGTRVLISLQAN